MKTWIRSISGRAVVAAFFLVGLSFSPAVGIELITRETFEAEKGAYKDYPFHLLFKKLAESSGVEKQLIKNLIILKQIFDPTMQTKEAAGVITYQRTYGIIKTLDNEKLKIYSADTGKDVEFHVGMDRVPLQNPNKYNVSDQNIGRYAAVVYTLDNRVYKVETSFLIARPEELSLKRENDKNRIGWRQPQTAQQPTEYNVFINDKPYQTVEETTVAVPIRSGQVDTYRVRAVYSHGKGRIESDASPPLQDTITRVEIEQERLAATMFAQVLSGLKPGQWEAARSRLYDSRGLLTASLSGPQQSQATGLTAFFKTVEEGDLALGKAPQTVAGIDEALAAYSRAGQQAAGLSPGIEVGFIVAEKTAAATELQAALKTQQQQALAAAQKPAAEPAAPPAPVVSAPPPRVVDSGAEIQQALGRFDEKNYTEALNHFAAVYSSQISNLQQRDQRQIKGLLSLPPKYRAEIIFLIEFERIRKKSNNDRDQIKMGLEDLLQDIENRQGPWVLIPEIRRERIKKHINEFQ
ncbi:MAG: hypothetical protein P1P89_00895 [Desulfobacterales bacterium]|nr:hypothetical protein [Desulfobacterales bacterium]